MPLKNWTFKPTNAAVDNQWCYVLKYMTQLWEALCDIDTGRNFVFNTVTNDNIIDGGNLPENYPFAGQAIGYHIFRWFQDIIVNNFQYFLKMENGSPIDYTSLNNINDWFWTTETFAIALGNQYATEDPSKFFRRYADNASYDGGTVEYGYAQEGDYIGPHLFEDIENCLSLMKIMSIRVTGFDNKKIKEASASNGGVQVPPNPNRWDDTKSDAADNWASTSPRNPFPWEFPESLPTAYTIGSLVNYNFWEGYPYWSVSYVRGWGTPHFSNGSFLNIHNSTFAMDIDADYQILVYAEKIGEDYDETIDDITWHYKFPFASHGDNVSQDAWTVAKNGTLSTIKSNSINTGGDDWDYQAGNIFENNDKPDDTDEPTDTYTIIKKGYKITDMILILNIDFPYSIPV